MGRIWPLFAITSLMVLVGVVWILQGLNVLPGSFMTGDPFWAAAGVGLLVASGVILALGVRKSARRPGD